METRTLRPTIWLAKRLGLSISTIERLRIAGSPDLPPAVFIGRSIRYDETRVEQWLTERMDASASLALPPQFVRARKKDAYRACGRVALESAEGSRPMNLIWRLESPLPARLFREFSVLRGV